MPRPRRAPGSPPDRNVRFLVLTESVRNGLWAIPAVAVVGVGILSVVLVRVDRMWPDLPSVFHGDPSSARGLLTTIASSTLTMTTLVLSITIVALQLASQQFSPRVMRTFFRDTGTKVALGIFLATTVYALLVLREVLPEARGRAEFVPDVSISLAFALILASLGAFVYYLDHVAHSIRAVHIINAVAAETRAAISDLPANTPMATDDWPERAPDLTLCSEWAPGVAVNVDEFDVVALARRHRVRIRLVPHIGDYVPSGAPLAEVWSDHEGDDPTMVSMDLRPLVGFGQERTMRQDVAFGLRQLVDVAEKALSPALNDPTTAVQALDHIHDLLRRLAVRPDPPGVFRDDDGVARLDLPTHGWDEMVHLGFDEIRQYGGGAFQVQRRMRATIDDLLVAVGNDPDRIAALEAQRSLLDRGADEHFTQPEDRRQAGMADDGSGG